MGIFDLFKGKSSREETREVDGYVIGTVSGIVYHCPRGLKEYRLPAGAKSLSNEACLDMNATAENIIIPSGFEKFDGDFMALSTSRNLKHIQFPEGIKEINPKYIPKMAEYNVPKSVKDLKTGVYENPPDGKLIIGENVSSIAILFASHDCGIRSVEIAGSVEIVPDCAFNQCKNLEQVILHEGIKGCGKDAFRGTNKLKLVELPEGFNGSFDAVMEARSGKAVHMGKESSYDSEKDYDNDANATMTINVERSGKRFSFNIRRGDFTSLTLDEQSISFNGGEISCDFSKMDPRCTHIIAGGQVVSKLPAGVAQQEWISGFKNNAIKTQTQSRTQMPEKTRTLEEQDFSKYSIKDVNKVLSDITKRTMGDALSYTDIDETAELSDDDSRVLAIALHARIEYYKKKAEEDPSFGEQYKKDLLFARNLEYDGVISSYSSLSINDKGNGGKYLKLFESRIKELNKENER